MKAEDIVGKRVKGFKFVGVPGWNSDMDSYIGKIGTIRSFYSNVCSINFDNHDSWAYPYPEVLEHLVEEEAEEEQSIEQILNNIKKLTSDICGTH